MIARRSFLASLLAAGASPAIVKAASIMRVRPSGIVAPVEAPMLLASELFAEPVAATTGSLLSIATSLLITGGKGVEPERRAVITSIPLDRTGLILGARYMSDGTAQPIWQ